LDGPKPHKLIVMSMTTGKVLADRPIVAGVDATNRFSPGVRELPGRKSYVGGPRFASGKFEIVQTGTTPIAPKTMDVDAEGTRCICHKRFEKKP